MVKELFSVKAQAHGGGGSMSVFFKWDPTAKFLATCGKNRRVHIFDRSGELIDEFPLSGQKPCIGLEWDATGDTLAALQEASSVIPLWSTNERKVKNLNTDLKDPSFMVWSRTKPMLAIGTHKGNLVIHDQKTSKSVALVGKHSKKITCGMWNLENKLALASMDKQMTISDEKGNTLDQAHLKYDPFDVQFAEQKVDEKQNMKENTVSINMGRATILMYSMTDTDNPVELAFQQKYGEIASYKWFGDGYMMVGFTKGYVIAISTHMKEIGEELQSTKLHDATITDLVYSAQLNKLASCAEDGVRVLDMQDWKELKSEGRTFTAEEGVPERLEWTRDGQILTVATSEGNVYNYLMSIPVLSNFYQQKLGYLSSLKNVTVIDVAAPDQPGISVEVDVEPNFMAVGPQHVAVGMNTHVYFYTCTKQDAGKVNEREYESGVKNMLLNERFAAVLCGGKVHLHPIARSQQQQNDELETRIFPEAKQTDVKDGAGGMNTSGHQNTAAAGGGPLSITSIGLTNDFLIYSTTRGSLHHFYLKDMAFVNEYIHDATIVAVYPNAQGTRVLFIDSANKGFLYSPIDDKSLEIPKFPPSIDKVLWDPFDSGVFAAIDNKSKQIATYVYTPQTTKGPVVTKVALTKLAHGFEPVLLWDGNIHGQKSNNGQVLATSLASHDAINFKPIGGGRRTPEKLKVALAQLLSLGRLKQAWDLALFMKNSKDIQPPIPAAELWRELAAKSMEQLDIDLAIRVCRELKDAGMVMALQAIQHVEDKHLLAGHICLLNRDYAKAQSLFLNSSAPLTALDMRKDLLEWNVAEKLAATLAPNQIPFICKEYATQLEVKGEYSQSLMMYQRAYDELKDNKSPQPADAEHIRQSSAGIARMTLRVGDLQRGKNYALKSGDKNLMKECALILESMKQTSDAAEMYVQAEQYEKAAQIYNGLKNFAKSGPLMDRITTPKIHAQYAKAKEMEKSYVDAEKAYEKAKDMESVVRLNLQYLENPQKAFAIVRKSRSAEGAAMVAEYCKSNGSTQAAIEFLLIAKHNEEAFKVAEQKNEMPAYAGFLGEDGTHDEYLSIATYYEGIKDFARAGFYYSTCGDYAKAVKLYLLCGESKLDDAIAVVKKAQGSAGSDLLTRAVLDYVTGETSATKQNPAFVYKLYLAIGDYGPALHTALLIAADEQKAGDYSGARQVLFDIHQKLIEVKMAVPAELTKSLLLLHSYALVKKFTNKLAPQPELAARMLIRVAKSISKFPNHTVQILTAAVIRCTQAELKKSAFEYATVLMRNETRDKIDAKYRKKIELIARRPDLNEKDEQLTPCPYCTFKVPATQLDCPDCKNTLPYCATTGRHMVADDWCICPNCKFTHSYDAFLKHLHAGNKCDMCNATVPVSAVNKINRTGGAAGANAGRAGGLSGDSKDFKDGGGGGGAGGAAGGDDSKLSAEMQAKIRDRESKMKGKKEDALNTEDL